MRPVASRMTTYKAATARFNHPVPSTSADRAWRLLCSMASKSSDSLHVTGIVLSGSSSALSAPASTWIVAPTSGSAETVKGCIDPGGNVVWIARESAGWA
eukprot:1361791-Rhodomonas_salina.3